MVWNLWQCKTVSRKSGIIKKASQLTGFFIALLIFRRMSMFVFCLRVPHVKFEGPACRPNSLRTLQRCTDIAWKSSIFCNHATHVLIQVAKILNLPCVRRYFYAIFSQSFWDQVAIRAKYDWWNNHARIIFQAFFEGGGCKVRRGRIAFIRQWPASLDICSVAHGASLYIEIFPVDIIREGWWCLN